MRDGEVLVTGAAGFIGYHLSARLLQDGYGVVGIDNLNSYYDVNLKASRLSRLATNDAFHFVESDIANADAVRSTFDHYKPRIVINLAAQAGVRYSLDNPRAYVSSNVVGFLNVLEGCRDYPVEHLLYASSSSVYGGNRHVPFRESDRVDHPVSLYAATKRSNELMAETYSHLYSIPMTGLRFFTVYGPYGRPDMAYYKFVDNYFSQKPIYVFNNGNEVKDLERDFTYIDDVIESVSRLICKGPSQAVQNQLYNIGGNRPERLSDFIACLEESLGSALGQRVEFEKVFEPIKPGDVPRTFADTSQLFTATGYRPCTGLKDGLRAFADWYVEYHSMKRSLSSEQGPQC